MKHRAGGLLYERLSPNRVFVARDGKGRWERQQTSGTFENLQVKAVCLSEINQNPQRVCFKLESLKNKRSLFLMELSRICAREIRSLSLCRAAPCAPPGQNLGAGRGLRVREGRVCEQRSS